jgi:hypothetical protein
MTRLWTTFTIIILLFVFIGYMVFDLALRKNPADELIQKPGESFIADKWSLVSVFEPGKGSLIAVAVSQSGRIYLGGDRFIASYDSLYNLLWEIGTDMSVTALAVSSDRVYAAANNIIIVFSTDGEKIDEWGPYEDKSFITSVSANENYIAYADAYVKSVFVLDNEGVVKHILGRSEDPFIIPSPYFDVVLGKDDMLYTANTGRRRIERRSIDGTLIDYFGTEGTAPDAFCGCCNPAHFTVIPGGFVTAEKGINRIKVLDSKGDFVEPVSFTNKFVPSHPLDIASVDGRIIYGANSADSKLYVFKRN